MPPSLPSVETVARGLLPRFSEMFGRELVQLGEEQGGEGEEREEKGEIEELRRLVRGAEGDARDANEKSGGWRREPDLSRREM